MRTRAGSKKTEGKLACNLKKLKQKLEISQMSDGAMD